MDSPLSAAFYADQAKQYDVVVEACERLAYETYLVRFACPDMARKITPGQFFMVRAGEGDDPLLGRAFALYDVGLDAARQPHAIEFVFHVVGKMTRQLGNALPGKPLVVWGPLGNGFDWQPTDHLIMVAGGIGQTPFMALAKETLGVQAFGGRAVPKRPRVSLCYGARRAELLAGLDDFRSVGVAVHVATDDGSAGHHGLVSELLAQLLVTDSPESPRVVCCGPEPMLEAVAKICLQAKVPCRVSLETPMACGLGICFSCVTKVAQDDGSWDFKRTCVDGPVFEASQLVWR